MPPNPQQATAQKITPVMITGMFLFFPLPAGVLLYMVIANMFQAFQTFLLTKEALPENLQKILDDQLRNQGKTELASVPISNTDRLPFEPKSKKYHSGAEVIEWDCKEEAAGNRPCQILMAVTLGPLVVSCGCCPVSMTGTHT